MTRVRVGAAILNQTPMDWEGNARRIREAIAEAREQGVAVLCLPELSISGYGCEDAFHSPGLHQTALELLAELLAETAGMVVSFGLPVLHRNGLYSAAALAADGRLHGLAAKRILAGEGIHYEPRWFKPWPTGARGELEVGGRAVPMGDLVFDCGGVRIGFEICEEAWASRRPGAELAAQGVDLILNPSASHFAFGKVEVRRRFVLEGSRAFGASYLYANLVGNESGRAIYDGGALVASRGLMLAEGPRFSYSEVHVTSAVVDVAASRMAQARSPSLEPAVGPPPGGVRVGFELPEVGPADGAPVRPGWETGTHVKEEELARAIALGLFDYVRKSRSRGFVVSLSGGADSSSIATLVGYMAHSAASELGMDGLARRLGHLPELASAGSPREAVRELLTCVYQSTRNSSETTRAAARAVAEGLGATYFELDVDEIVERYVSLVEASLGRELTWERDDLALQNVQARVRSPGAWLFANVRGALLLATSNRSEAAVGYATMDGDTSGGLAPIAGVDKAFLRRWLRWMESRGPEGWEPQGHLARVNAQQPTAELRPGATQTDEDDLMPYEVLDAVEKAVVRDKLSPLEAWQLATGRFPGHGRAELALWVERFCRLWARNQWKRERYAPSFHLDDENVDPKTWCRYPILSGGFERELAELREAVAAGGGEPGA